MDTQADRQDARGTYGERVAVYHPNAKGSGAVARLEPSICRRDGRPACFFLELATQKTAAGRDEDGPSRATFDWENKITVKLGFLDICHLLAVLEGKAEHAGGKRDGIYHQSGRTNTLIHLARHEAGGYFLALSRKRGDEDEAKRIGMVLSEVEATGVRHVLSVGLFFMTLPPDVMGAREDSSLRNAKVE